jgi:parallel beta-helix repeat protein
MGYGISLSSTSTNNVSGNTILTLNANSFGVYLYNTNGNYFYNNSIITYKDDAGADSSYGVYLYSGASNTFRNNNVTTYMAPCFVSYTAYNSNIDTSNLAEGKPVWFNDSLRNYIFQNVNFTNYGQVVCANCQNVTYNNVTIRNDGLFLGKTNNSFVYNSDIISNNSDGIYLFYSKYNLINNTNISETQNDVNALKIRVNSDNNTIQNSYINESTNEMAIYMQNSDNVTFYNNLINSKGSNYAVLMYGSTDYENFTKNVFDTVWGLVLDSQSSTESYFDKNDFNCGGSYTVNTNRGSNHYLFTDNNFRGDKIYFGVASSSHRYNLTNATNFGGFYYYVQTSNTGQVNLYLDVYVNNSKGNNLENANVSAWNSQSNLKFTELTNSSGWINKKILKDYYQNYTNIYYDHNYTMNTTKFGYFNDSRNFELVNNRVEYVTLYGTPPVITIISPNSTYEYFTLDVDFNISVVDDESISQCYYNINQTTNVSMIRVNDSYFWAEPSLIPGTHNVTFWCNDTSGNWGANSTNFTILNEAAISIQLSPALSWSVNWTLINLPADDLSANGNNGLGATDYYINISAISVTVDLYVKADGDLLNDAWDVLGLGNETYAINTTNSTVPDLDKTVMSTNYVLIGDSLVDGSVVYMKFYLDAPAGQPAGTYTNDLSFKAVMHGQSP